MGVQFNDNSPGYVGNYECIILGEVSTDPACYLVLMMEGPDKGKKFTVAWTVIRTSR